MPTLLEDDPPHAAVRDSSAAERLQSTMATTRLSFTWFLTDLGLVSTGHGTSGSAPTGFSNSLLLRIGQVLRLRRWEIQQLDLHRRAGLPNSSEAFHHLTNASSDSELTEFVTQLGAQIFRIFIDHFVWSARDCDLRADLAVVVEDDDALLDAIADFLISQSQRDIHAS